MTDSRLSQRSAAAKITPPSASVTRCCLVLFRPTIFADAWSRALLLNATGARIGQ